MKSIRKRILSLFLAAVLATCVLSVAVACDKTDASNTTQNNTNTAYSVLLNADGGECAGSASVTYGEKYALPVPEKEGYSFVGWMLDGKLITRADGKSIGTWRKNGDAELIANWQIKRYNVKIEGTSGGKVLGGGDLECEHFSRQTAVATAYLGYKFVGWRKDDGIVSNDATLCVDVSEDAIYTAVFNVLDSMSNFEFEASENTCRIVGVKDSGITLLHIPKEVTSISSDAFATCSKVEHISVDAQSEYFRAENDCLIEKSTKSVVRGCMHSVIPQSKQVIKIARKAFANVEGLTDVNITKNIEKIDDFAFWYTQDLVNITIESTAFTVIGRYAFAECKNLQTVTISTGITAIGEYAFYRCDSLQTVNLPSSVKLISNKAFSGCAKLQTVDLSKVTEIGEYAFESCAMLTSVNIDSAKIIGYNAFYGCGWLENGRQIENGVVYIGKIAYSYVGELENVTLRSDTTAVADRAFLNCTTLKTINLGSNITEIGREAFGGCTQLAQIVIPNKVKSLGMNAFSGCSALTTVSTPIDIVYNLPKETITTINITSGEQIYERMFAGWDKLQNVTVASSIKTVGDFAFFGCASLNSIGGFGGVENIGRKAFHDTGWYNKQNGVVYIDKIVYSCKSGTTNADIKSGTTSILAYAFEDCENLTSLTIPRTITSIGTQAFVKCTNLKTVDLPAFAISHVPRSELTTITINGGGALGDGYFSGCEKLETLTIKDVEDIHSNTFAGCTKLTSATVSAECAAYLPRNVKTVDISYGTTIADFAFDGCSNLTSLTIGSTVTNIGKGILGGCDALSTLTSQSTNFTAKGKCLFSGSTLIAGGNNPTISGTTIADYAFYRLTRLGTITIPKTATVGFEAFKDCSGLTNATLPTSAINSIPRADLTSVTINGGDTIPSYAFNNSPKLATFKYSDTTINYVGTYALHNTGWLGNQSKTTDLYIGNAFYRCGTALTSGKRTVSNTCVSISGRAFESVAGTLTEVVIPTNVTSVAADAFSGCTALKTATVPVCATTALPRETITKVFINESKQLLSAAFSGCVKLIHVALSGEPTSYTIPSYAFYGCENLEDVSFRDGIDGSHTSSKDEGKCQNAKTVIGDYAFYGCAKLKGRGNGGDTPNNNTGYKLNFNNIVGIGAYAFYGCTSLQGLCIGAEGAGYSEDKIFPIGEYALSNCGSIYLFYWSTHYISESNWKNEINQVMKQNSTLYIGTTVTVRNENKEKWDKLYYYG